MTKAQYVMVGGFLGAGKTTAIIQMARLLAKQNLTVGLITNDQSQGLVDTTMTSSTGFPVEEITGGCFCCKFDSLVSAADRLSKDKRPDVFLAEPVGSCTDLKATVDYPLRRMYGSDYWIAPLSVMVDPIRALRILNLEKGRSFSDKVTYIYNKQLEEADIIVINKIDLISTKRVQLLKKTIQEVFDPAHIVLMSARQGQGTQEWLEGINHSGSYKNMGLELDYDTYAEGEALLGWLNCTAQIEGIGQFDGNLFLLKLLNEVKHRVKSLDKEIAHLKVTLIPSENGQDIGVVNLVRNELDPEVSFHLKEKLNAGELILNLRAECDPEILHSVFMETCKSMENSERVKLIIEHIEFFKPGRPVPTHRLEPEEQPTYVAQK